MINGAWFTQKIFVLDTKAGGGMAPAIVGTLVITFWATLLAVPLGVLAAIYLHEYGGQGRLARVIRFMSDVMTGVPSIIMGLFIFVVFTLPLGANGLIGFGGSLALACLMLPIVIRSSEEMLRLVPDDLRQASYALGNRKWRTIMTVVLPAALGGMVSGDHARRRPGRRGDGPAAVHHRRRPPHQLERLPRAEHGAVAADLEQLAEPLRPGPEPGLGRGADAGAAWCSSSPCSPAWSPPDSP